jgi:hypothetical protein
MTGLLPLPYIPKVIGPPGAFGVPAVPDDELLHPDPVRLEQNRVPGVKGLAVDVPDGLPRIVDGAVEGTVGSRRTDVVRRARDRRTRPEHDRRTSRYQNPIPHDHSPSHNETDCRCDRAGRFSSVVLDPPARTDGELAEAIE